MGIIILVMYLYYFDFGGTFAMVGQVASQSVSIPVQGIRCTVWTIGSSSKSLHGVPDAHNNCWWIWNGSLKLEKANILYCPFLPCERVTLIAAANTRANTTYKVTPAR